MQSFPQVLKSLPDSVKIKEDFRNNGILRNFKEIKQLKETIEMTPADRTDILAECNSRLAVLEEYAPKMMDEEEIKAVVSEVLAALGLDAPTAKEKGKIMKELMPKVKGKADGKLVSEVVASFLS